MQCGNPRDVIFISALCRREYSGPEGTGYQTRTDPSRAQHLTALTSRCASRVEGRSARKGHQSNSKTTEKISNCKIGRFGCNSRQRQTSPFLSRRQKTVMFVVGPRCAGFARPGGPRAALLQNSEMDLITSRPFASRSQAHGHGAFGRPAGAMTRETKQI